MSNQRHFLTSIVFAMASAAGFTTSATAGDLTSKTSDVDAIFNAFDRPDSPGCAVGVVKDKQLIFEKGYGMASLEHNVPNSAHAVYFVGSTSKQFAAASVAIAAIEGDFSLDDDIRRYLPEMPDYGTPITIRHLIHHTNGFRDFLSLMLLAGMPFENIYDDEQTLTLIANQKGLNHTPGAQYSYNNTGYFLLGQIIHRATGKTLQEYAREKIFAPLGMNHTDFHDDRLKVVENRAAAYKPGKNEDFLLDWYLNFDRVGSGGLLTTVEDLMLWDRNFYDDQLGDGKLVRQMLEPGSLKNGETLDYAFGLFHGEYQGLSTVHHGGAFMGFRAEMLRFPTKKLSTIVLCNVNTAQAPRLAEELAAVFLEIPPSAAAKTQMEEVTFVQLPETVLQHYSGGYRDPESRHILRASVDTGELVFTGAPFPLRFAAISTTEFRSKGLPMSIELRFKNDGTAFEVDMPGAPTRTYEAVSLVATDDVQLSDYTGEFYSEELGSSFFLSIKDEKLLVRRGSNDEELLSPTTEDAFQFEGLILEFSRNSKGRVSGMTLNSGRVLGVLFERQ